MSSESYQRRSWRIRPSDESCLVPGRVAEILHAKFDLRALRTQALGRDDELYDVLLSLHQTSLAWRSSASGTEVAPSAELAAESKWMSTKQAAEVLDMTPRGVRKAITDGRLEAEQVGTTYRVSTEAAIHYKSARTYRAEES